MEEFDWREPLVKTEVFGQESDLPANLYVASRDAEYKSLTLVGLAETEKHFNRGAFPGAVGAEETEDFAAAHFQRKDRARRAYPQKLWRRCWVRIAH